MNNNYRVLGSKVLVEQDLPVAASSIIHGVAGSETFLPFATILGVGPEVKALSAGQRVVFKRTPGTAISPEARKGDEHYGILVLPEDAILAVIS